LSGTDAASIGLSDRLGEFAAMLRASPHNLLSPKALTELESRHFPESLLFAQALPVAGALLDVGSGGGLPGIVIAIARPELAVHLMESTGKKARFLEEVGARLELDLVVHQGRAEDLAKGPLRGTFDIVTARAVAPLDRLVPITRPFLRSGGTLHAIKGARWAEELEAARVAIDRAGMTVESAPDGLETGVAGPLVVVLRRA